MKQNLKQKLISRKVKAPNKLLSKAGMFVLGRLCKKKNVTFSYDYDKKQYKNTPAILIATHTARLEFIYALYGFGQSNINIVMGYQNIMKKGLYGFLLQLGVISKYLYQPDVNCTKNMLAVLKRKGSLALFPEGIQSTSGSTHPINPTTCKFLKKSNVPIILCKSEGSYLSTNRYSKDVKKGKIHVHYQLLFTLEELKTLSEEEIYKRLIYNFKYNDFESNKKNRWAYVGKKPNIDGLNNIIYKCPHCNSEFTLQMTDTTMKCTSCGFEVSMNEYYDLLPVHKQLVFDDVDKWYKWQRKVIHNQVKQDDFVLKTTGSLHTLRTDKLVKPPKNRVLLTSGTITLNNKALTITDKDGNQTVFDAKGLYSLTFTKSGYFEFYYNEEYYVLVVDMPQTHMTKWTLASEEIHNLYDERWRLASKDVYDYE